MARLRCYYNVSTSVLALLACPAIAMAQSASQAPQPASASGSQMLGEIVVTAQRRTENLQKVALPVSAVSAAQLTNAGVTDVTSLTKLVPSLIVQPATGTSV